MLIIPQFINTRIGGTNVKHYRALGYNVKFYEFITVPIEHLPLGSHEEVQVQCDYCHKFFTKKYKVLLKEREKSVIKKDCCKECIHEKDKETNLFLYGVENPMHREEVKKKLRNTFLEVYGFEYNSQSSEVKEKVSKTVSNFSEEKKQDIKDKTKQTNLERYGFEYYNQSPEGKERFKNTCLEKYGVENPLQNEEIMDKEKQTLLQKYGVDNYFKSNIFKENNKIYWLEKEGVEYYSQTEDCKKKVSLAWENMSPEFLEDILRRRTDTLIEKYGTDSMLTITKTGFFYANGQRTSSQQIKIYEYILEKYTDWKVIINFLFRAYCLDILMSKDNILIDIEYDGWFWHNEEKDKKRDDILISSNYKILRIKSGYKVPEKENLYAEINSLISDHLIYKEIILDDWNKRMNLTEWRAEK